MLGVEIMRGKKRLVHDGVVRRADVVHAGSFNCSAPLQYFEKTRKKCGHEGRCREEGLLLALLSGKKHLDYAQRTVQKLPRPIREIRETSVEKLTMDGGRSS
jgi:hypothetical protein